MHCNDLMSSLTDPNLFTIISNNWTTATIDGSVDILDFFLLENLLWGLALTNNCLNPFLAWHLHFHGIVMAGERSTSLTYFISNRKHGSTTSEAITLKAGYEDSLDNCSNTQETCDLRDI